jgi:hypothetical protein
MTPLITALLLMVSVVTSAASPPQPDAKAIVGTWMFDSRWRPSRIIVFHADGRWGVKKLEEGPEDIRGRRWWVKGNHLVLKYPSDDGFDTASYRIVSFTAGKFVTDIHGYESTYTRMP